MVYTVLYDFSKINYAVNFPLIFVVATLSPCVHISHWRYIYKQNQNFLYDFSKINDAVNFPLIFKVATLSLCVHISHCRYIYNLNLNKNYLAVSFLLFRCRKNFHGGVIRLIIMEEISGKWLYSTVYGYGNI